MKFSVPVNKLRLVPKIVWLAIGVEVYYLAIAFGVYKVVSSWDTLVRYAPMAEAFARGDFAATFHPRFCMLFQVVTGILVWLTGIDGVHACQFVAVTSWVVSGVVLWRFAVRLFGEAAAWWGTLVFYVGSEFFEYGCEGFRDDLRILPVLMLCLAFDRLLFPRDGESPWTGSLIMAASLCMLTLLRVDCLPICAVALLAYGVICFFRRSLSMAILPCALFVLAVLALCTMTCFYTGWFVPSSHYIRLFWGAA